MNAGESRPTAGHETAARQPGEPIINLLDPAEAPSDLLELVTVNEVNQSLDAPTSLGVVSAELYYSADKDGLDTTQASFYGALDPALYSLLDPALDPAAAGNPIATQENPYAIVPFGSFYSIAVRAPLEALAEDWSDEREEPVTDNDYGFVKMQFPMRLADFKRRYPHVEVDLPEGEYDITMKYQAKPTIVVAVRAEDGEPLVRHQIIIEKEQQPAAANDIEGDIAALAGGADLDSELAGLDETIYNEMPFYGYFPSSKRPDTAVMLLRGRLTMSSEDPDGTLQRLQFAEHDVFSRADVPDAKRGALEVIVYKATAINIVGFTFSSPESGAKLLDDIGLVAAHQVKEPALAFSRSTPEDDGPGLANEGLASGETRYMEPESVNVEMGQIRNPRPIAAFQFSLAAQKSAA